MENGGKFLQIHRWQLGQAVDFNFLVHFFNKYFLNHFLHSVRTIDPMCINRKIIIEKQITIQRSLGCFGLRMGLENL